MVFSNRAKSPPIFMQKCCNIGFLLTATLGLSLFVTGIVIIVKYDEMDDDPNNVM